MNYRNNTTPKLLVIAIIMILVGIILQPRLANEHIPPIRSSSLDSFIQKSVREQKVDRKDFWEFRDRHSLGRFDLETKQVSINPLLKRVNVPDFIPQLSFTSKSIESLGGQTQLSSLPTDSAMPDSSFKIKTSSTRLFEAENEYILISLTPLNEERSINGFVNKIKLVKGKEYWLEVTKITK